MRHTGLGPLRFSQGDVDPGKGELDPMMTLLLQRSHVWLEDGCGGLGRSIAELALLPHTHGDLNMVFPLTVEARPRMQLSACTVLSPSNHSC